MTYELCIYILALSGPKPLFAICRLHYADDYVELTKAMFHKPPINALEAVIRIRFATFVANSQIADPFVVKPPRYYARAIIVTINVISV